MAERLTMQEVIEHCERTVIQAEMLRFTDTKQYMEHKQVREWLEELQHYKDLEEQGRLIELPCKVGDTVYYITGIHNTLIKPTKVEEVYFGDVFAVHVSTQNTSFTLVEGEFFLTKEEAEAALKGADK